MGSRVENGGRPARWLRVTDSTNRVAREWAERGAPHGALVWAERQTAGRGRLGGRVWESPAGLGMYATWVARPRRMVAGDTALLAGEAARVVREALAGMGVGELSLKPPNDVFAGGRKIAGILVEPRLAGDGERVEFFLAGIGVNVRQREEDFPEALRGRATSCLLCGVDATVEDVLAAVGARWHRFADGL